MPSEPNKPPVEIRFTPEFKRNLRALSKRYHHLRSEIEPILTPQSVILITLYSKTEPPDTSATNLRRTIHEFEETP